MSASLNNRLRRLENQIEWQKEEQRKCREKARYLNAAIAKQMQPTHLTYQCRWCGHWHTSQPKGGGDA